MIWRVTPKQGGRGEHRKLVDNVHFAQWEYVWQRRHPGAGRYRIEFRDARRLIAKVEYVNALSPEQGGQVIRTEGRYRPSKRTVPPPVQGWDSSTPSLEQRKVAAREAALRQAAPKVSTAAQRTVAKSPTAPQRSAARAYPPLKPPGPVSRGMFWRLRQNGQWEPISGEHGRGLPNYVLLWLPHGEYIFVYSPEKKWPGHIIGKLKDGTECLFVRE